MGEGFIAVSTENLRNVENAVSTAGESYLRNFTRLTNLINEIVAGDIRGDAADDLLQKYQAKEVILKAIQKSLDEADECVRGKQAGFNQLMGNIKSGMK